jgi:hypothetical protein
MADDVRAASEVAREVFSRHWPRLSDDCAMIGMQTALGMAECAIEADRATRPAAAASPGGGARCAVTGNPVGTDTHPVGQPCQCAPCLRSLTPRPAARPAATVEEIARDLVQTISGLPDPGGFDACRLAEEAIRAALLTASGEITLSETDSEEVARLRDEREQIMLAVMGGEDAPGVAASCTLDDVKAAMADYRRAFNHQLARAEAAEAKLARAMRFVPPHLRAEVTDAPAPPSDADRIAARGDGA